LDRLCEALDWSVQPKRSFGTVAVAAAAYWAAMTFFALGPFVAVIVSFAYKLDRNTINLVFGIPMCLFVLGAVPVFRSARRDWLATLSRFPERALGTSIKPVMYLRRFDAENPNLTQGLTRHFGPFGLFEMDVESWLEDEIAAGIAALGPTIALGAHRASRSIGRTSRLYALNARWQLAVEELDRISSAVFMHYVTGGSLDWELKRFLRSEGKPFVLFVENMDQFQPPRSLRELGRRPVYVLPPNVAAAAAHAGFGTGHSFARPENASDAALVIFANGQVTLHWLNNDASDVRHVLRSAISARQLRSEPSLLKPLPGNWRYTTMGALPVVAFLPIAFVTIPAAQWLSKYLG
jgi:hypothetical protein